MKHISKRELWAFMKKEGFIEKAAVGSGEFYCSSKHCNRLLLGLFEFEKESTNIFGSNEKAGYDLPHDRYQLQEIFRKLAAKKADGSYEDVQSLSQRCLICTYRGYRKLFMQKYGQYPDDDVPNNFNTNSPIPPSTVPKYTGKPKSSTSSKSGSSQKKWTNEDFNDFFGTWWKSEPKPKPPSDPFSPYMTEAFVFADTLDFKTTFVSVLSSFFRDKGRRELLPKLKSFDGLTFVLPENNYFMKRISGYEPNTFGIGYQGGDHDDAILAHIGFIDKLDKVYQPINGIFQESGIPLSIFSKQSDNGRFLALKNGKKETDGPFLHDFSFKRIFKKLIYGDIIPEGSKWFEYVEQYLKDKNFYGYGMTMCVISDKVSKAWAGYRKATDPEMYRMHVKMHIGFFRNNAFHTLQGAIFDVQKKSNGNLQIGTCKNVFPVIAEVNGMKFRLIKGILATPIMLEALQGK